MDDQTPRYYEGPDGTKAWQLQGMLHKLDGPAYEFADGSLSWWLYGNYYSFDEFLEQTTCSPETKCILKLRYG